MIRWPESFEPARCPIHVRNELAISASPEAVWARLIRAQVWPSWYPNARRVRFLQGPPPDLALGTRFRWRTFGISIESTVEEFVPNERLAWNAVGMGVRAYHAWLIEPRPGGCWVLTEETQRGWLARLSAALMPGRMHRFHQIWLERLAKVAAGGPT
jgi:uncharacterized protein YndB with AHSA1/START domain